jgi:hypothetical protein
MKAPLREYAYMDPISVTWQQEAREHLRQARTPIITPSLPLVSSAFALLPFD